MGNRRFFTILALIFTLFLIDVSFAQLNQQVDSATKKMAIKIRLKSRLIRIKKPVLYVGFHNSNPDLKPLEEAVESEFLNKLKDIMVLDSLEVSANMESYDHYPLSSLNINSSELSKIIPEPNKYSYIIHGIIEKSPAGDEIILRSRLYNLPYDNSLVETSATIQN
ncbi:MAG: hypothetical protein Kow0037_13690 [Calditrichia bacterium]